MFLIVFAAFGGKTLDTSYPKASDTVTVLSERLNGYSLAK